MTENQRNYEFPTRMHTSEKDDMSRLYLEEEKKSNASSFGAEMPIPAGQIEELLDRVMGDLNRLHELRIALGIRLMPVLLPEHPSDGDCDNVMKGDQRSPLSQRLLAISSRLRELEAQIDDLGNRIDL